MLDRTPAYLLDSDPPASASPAPAEEGAPIDERMVLDAYSEAVASVAEKVGPAVVRVDSRAGQSGREPEGGRPGRGGHPDRGGRGSHPGHGGTGSGVVISPDGLVLTNA